MPCWPVLQSEAAFSQAPEEGLKFRTLRRRMDLEGIYLQYPLFDGKRPQRQGLGPFGLYSGGQHRDDLDVQGPLSLAKDRGQSVAVLVTPVGYFCPGGRGSPHSRSGPHFEQGDLFSSLGFVV
ncbi:hypothetical protein AVEN_1831-1 [Araneus ventricosus]|uniref:Uncharacterized protein n=1 Tax=Araneus ventricosus TaxID=182803 RepID=A0A4Y2SVW7_ARAVE|nr:hypothetical protein AVEN_1831-1 [Araneus ventricosus]